MESSNTHFDAPMPLVFFDHESDRIWGALGLSKVRSKELDRAMEDLFDSELRDKFIPFDKVTEKLEATMNLARNEQERVFVIFEFGRLIARNSGHHHIQIEGGEGLSDEIKEAILRSLRKRGGDSDKG